MTGVNSCVVATSVFESDNVLYWTGVLLVGDDVGVLVPIEKMISSSSSSILCG